MLLNVFSRLVDKCTTSVTVAESNVISIFRYVDISTPTICIHFSTLDLILTSMRINVLGGFTVRRLMKLLQMATSHKWPNQKVYNWKIIFIRYFWEGKKII